MKSCKKQWKPRKMEAYSQKTGAAIEKPWRNSEGYHDPTAQAALRNIERTAKPKAR